MTELEAADMQELREQIARLRQQRNHLVAALCDIKMYTAGDGDTLRKLAALALDTCP